MIKWIVLGLVIVCMVFGVLWIVFHNTIVTIALVSSLIVFAIVLVALAASAYTGYLMRAGAEIALSAQKSPDPHAQVIVGALQAIKEVLRLENKHAPISFLPSGDEQGRKEILPRQTIIFNTDDEDNFPVTGI